MAVLRLSFQRTRLEAAFAAHHAAAHSTADPAGFAFALWWTAAVAYRTAAAGASFAELAFLAVLSLLVIAAAVVRSTRQSVYLTHREATLSALRLLFTAAGCAVQFRLAGSATSAAAAAVGPAQLVALTVLPLCWSLRAKVHFPVQLAGLAAAAACNYRLAAAAAAQPAVAAGVARFCAALHLSMAPERFLIVLWVVLQVQLGFHLPSSFLYAAEAAARDRFLGAYLLQCAAAFQRGSYRLGVARTPRAAPLPSPFTLPVAPIGLPTGLAVAAATAAAAAAAKADDSASSDTESNASDDTDSSSLTASSSDDSAVAFESVSTHGSKRTCWRDIARGVAAEQRRSIGSAPAFASVSTHGGKRACWRDAARSAVAEQRQTRLPHRNSLESISTGSADLSLQLALAIMQRRPVPRSS